MLVFLLLSLVSSSNVVSSGTLDCIPVVMAGYDVVYYFKDSTYDCDAAKGSPHYYYNLDSADNNGTLRTYQFWFTSQQNLDYFSADPWKYAPKYGGFCSYGTCCETDPTKWPWSATWQGPPAGPDSSRCGFRVDNGSLYMNIWDSYDTYFFVNRDNINQADDRWKSWFGSMQAGPFNYGCFSTSGWHYMDCVYTPLDDAPAADDVERLQYQRCNNVPTTQTTESPSATVAAQTGSPTPSPTRVPTPSPTTTPLSSAPTETESQPSAQITASPTNIATGDPTVAPTSPQSDVTPEAPQTTETLDSVDTVDSSDSAETGADSVEPATDTTQDDDGSQGFTDYTVYTEDDDWTYETETQDGDGWGEHKKHSSSKSIAKSTTGLMIIIGGSTVAFIIIVIVTVVYFRNKRLRRESGQDSVRGYLRVGV